jgi:hypothetical protein
MLGVWLVNDTRKGVAVRFVEEAVNAILKLVVLIITGIAFETAAQVVDVLVTITE